MYRSIFFSTFQENLSIKAFSRVLIQGFFKDSHARLFQGFPGLQCSKEASSKEGTHHPHRRLYSRSQTTPSLKFSSSSYNLSYPNRARRLWCVGSSRWGRAASAGARPAGATAACRRSASPAGSSGGTTPRSGGTHRSSRTTAATECRSARCGTERSSRSCWSTEVCVPLKTHQSQRLQTTHSHCYSALYISRRNFLPKGIVTRTRSVPADKKELTAPIFF